MPRSRYLKTALAGGVCAMALATAAFAQAQPVDVPAGDLGPALDAYIRQSGVQLVYRVADVRGLKTPGVQGALEPEAALSMLLSGTRLAVVRDPSGALAVAQAGEGGSSPQSGGAGDVDALIVTAQKREENIQDVPIAMSAFSQEDLTRSQVAGGPDLMTQVPNMTFTKTNFSGYSIQIRGIGTQAVSATTDAAVAVAFNNASMIRNRFFEQEFYDLERIEVLRGPQGTLYGRNATAGVVNILSAKPKFVYEAKASGDVSNYNSSRVEGMLNIPLVEDVAALRLAGAWTKRDGYVTNQLTGDQIDGRDLWSTRVSLRVEPTDRLSANLIWEHFEEDDDRLRSGKQLCKKHTPLEIGGVPVVQDTGYAGGEAATYSQGCLPASMYAKESFQTPNGYSLPYYVPLNQIGNWTINMDPYVSATQSTDLRVIESMLTPKYRAQSDVAQLQVSYDLTDYLTLVSETAYSSDELFSFGDFNRFNTKPGAFDGEGYRNFAPDGGALSAEGVFCDPQLGCSDRLVLGDLSTAKSSQFSQEIRLSSDYDGRLNFSLGANFLRYDTEDKYYVFVNSLSLWAASFGEYAESTFVSYVPGVTTNGHCLESRLPGDPNDSWDVLGCIPIDPNGVDNLDDTGHNYFLSKNPYKLLSYALFGEAYYDLAPDLKLTAGLRWTLDKKAAPRIPSWLIAGESITRPADGFFGYPIMETVRQEWSEPTGRLAIDWKPDAPFTDETLVYASYARGYKAGGMNPPPAVIAHYSTTDYSGQVNDSIIQPKTFDAEFVNAFEVGTKNTLLDGALTLNLAAFYYDYTNYQLSQIVNRSAVTQNFDAKVWGLEIEADWRPLENLRLGFKGGYQDTRVANGEQAIDLIDRTAGNPGWVVSRPFPTVPSNCILPVWLVAYGDRINVPNGSGGVPGACVHAYYMGLDPVTLLDYEPDPTVFYSPGVDPADWVGYPGFDPSTAPNNGEGFFKDLGGNELPNAPNFTATIMADYTLPLPSEWLMTLHTDLYYQSEAWTRIFNMEGYDKLKAYTNVNFAAIFTNEDAGWNVMAYVKNVFDRDSITGAFLNSDDTGLTTNVFLTEPRLYGVRVTKQFTGEPLLGSLFGGGRGRAPGEPYPFTVELGGSVLRIDAPNETLSPEFLDNFPSTLDPRASQHKDLDWGDGREITLTYRPAGPWTVSAAARFGRTNGQGGTIRKELVPWQPYPPYSRDKYRYAVSETTYREEHTIVDFSVGAEVGLGQLNGRSDVSVSLRYAEFKSASTSDIGGTPEYYTPPSGYFPAFRTEYVSTFSAARSFKGAGPVITWDASKPFWRREESGDLSLDVSLSAGVLFGRQKASVGGGGYTDLKYNGVHTVSSLPSVSNDRSKRVTVPIAGANLGLSYEIDRVKLSGGYRWERYFNVIDGGYLERDAKDRTIDGPYFKIAVGFGG